MLCPHTVRNGVKSPPLYGSAQEKGMFGLRTGRTPAQEREAPHDT